MKVVFVNRFFFPDESATSQMVSGLAFGLAEKGGSVDVITGCYRHNGIPLPTGSEIIGGVTVHRVWVSSFGCGRLSGRALEYLTFHFSVWRYLRRLVRPNDIVVACTDPPLLSVTAMLGSRWSGALLVNWILDLFPEAAIQLGMLNPKGFSARMLCRLRDASIRKARSNIVLAPPLRGPLEARGIARSALTVIPLWANGDLIRPIPWSCNTLLSKWRLQNKIVVGYSGNFGRVHDFTTILNAAERFREYDEIVFLFIGDGFQRRWVENEVARRGLTNVLMKPLQPPEHLAETLGAAEIHLISLLPHLEACSFPSKLYGILAAGRPAVFIGDRDGETARILREAQCGSAVAIGDADALVERIIELARSAALRRQMGENARRLFDARYKLEIGVDSWRQLLEQVSAAGRSGTRNSKPATQGAPSQA